MDRGTLFSGFQIAIEREHQKSAEESLKARVDAIQDKRRQAKEFIAALNNIFKALLDTPEEVTLDDIPYLDNPQIGVYYVNGPYRFAPEIDPMPAAFTHSTLMVIRLLWPDGQSHTFRSAVDLIGLIEMTNKVWKLDKELVRTPDYYAGPIAGLQPVEVR